jgi:hypothetical protein
MKVLLGLVGFGLLCWLLWPVTDALGVAGIGLVLGIVICLVIVCIVWVLARETQDAAYSHIERMASLQKGRENWTAISHDGSGSKQITHERW